MVRQIVLFRFRDDVSEADRDSLLAELDGFPDEFPQMRNWMCGVNRSARDDRFSHAFVVDFDSDADLQAYLSSERHETFVHDRWRPIIAERAIVTLHV